MLPEPEDRYNIVTISVQYPGNPNGTNYTWQVFVQTMVDTLQ